MDCPRDWGPTKNSRTLQFTESDLRCVSANKWITPFPMPTKENVLL